MRELKQGKIDGKIYLFPVPVIKERKYLIYCTSDEEAKNLIKLVQDKVIPHPDLLSEYFRFICLHTDQQTKIFSPVVDLLTKVED